MTSRRTTEPINADIRMHLNAADIATVPKQDGRRIVLDFVHGQQPFAKAYAKEGKAYMASWKDESATIGSTSEKEHPPQSCGFATPVLKPRKRPHATGYSSRNERHTKRGKEFDSKIEGSTDVHKGHKAKSRDRITHREERRRDSSKRGPDQQTEEEQRLQERREKKKARREIMKPETSRRKQTEMDVQLKTKKKKQNLPSGLALMYGFTASNVGQKRLTVGPLTRPGVFGKGKASVQATVRRSKQKSSRNNDAAFSESDFLKSAGKDLGEKVATTCSSASDTTSSESSGGQEQLEPESPVRRVTRDKPKVETAVRTREKLGGVVANPLETEEKSTSTSHSPLKPSSVVWDIEKAGGVLPTASSSLVSLGPKPSTLLLDVAQKKWPLECPHTDGPQEIRLSIEQADPAAKPPSVASIRPSESPSQVNHPTAGTRQNPPEGVSKYFSSGLPPQVEHDTHSPKDTDRVIQILEDTTPALGTTQLVKPSSPLDYAAELPTAPDPTQLDFDPELLFFSDEVAHYSRRNLDGSDWLLSDPFLGRYSTSPSAKDGWAALEGMSVIQLEDQNEDGPTALEQVYFLDEEPRTNSGFSLWLDEDPQPDHYSEGLLGSNKCEDLPNLEQTSDEDTGLDWNDLIYLESDGSESDSDLRENIKVPQEDYHNIDRDHLICFDEGRYLLHGNRISEAVDNLELVEADVAQSLVGHWKPQKY